MARRQASSSLRSCGVSACLLRPAGVAALRYNQRFLSKINNDDNKAIFLNHCIWSTYNRFNYTYYSNYIKDFNFKFNKPVLFAKIKTGVEKRDVFLLLFTFYLVLLSTIVDFRCGQMLSAGHAPISSGATSFKSEIFS